MSDVVCVQICSYLNEHVIGQDHAKKCAKFYIVSSEGEREPQKVPNAHRIAQPVVPRTQERPVSRATLEAYQCSVYYHLLAACVVL